MSSKAKRVPKHLLRFTTFMTTFPAVHSSRDQWLRLICYPPVWILQHLFLFPEQIRVDVKESVRNSLNCEISATLCLANKSPLLTPHPNFLLLLFWTTYPRIPKDTQTKVVTPNNSLLKPAEHDLNHVVESFRRHWTNNSVIVLRQIGKFWYRKFTNCSFTFTVDANNGI